MYKMERSCRNSFSFRRCWLLLAGISLFHTGAQSQPSLLQKEAITYIDKNQPALTAWSDSIWQYAEPSFLEHQSAAMLVGILKKEGFAVQENVCGFSTVFIATYGSTKPVIGLYGEYDADSNASNKTVPYRDELIAGGYGHGGAHNLLGVGSLGAALAIKDLIKKGKLNCSIRYYGSTSEGRVGTRAWLARDGYFNDLDMSLYWHPAPITVASTGTWDALIDFDVLFAAKRTGFLRDSSAGKNAQHAFELFVAKIVALKETLPPDNKMNYMVKQWNADLGTIPDTLRLGFRIQCRKQADALNVFDSITQTLNHVSAQSGVTGEIKVSRALHQFLPNVTAMKLVRKNMTALGMINYSNEEIDYSLKMQTFLKNKPDTIKDVIPPFFDDSKRPTLYGYASDIGEASWIAPEIYFIVRCFPSGVAMHRWQGAAFTAHSIGHKGMLQAAKLLSMTIIDYVKSSALQDAILKDFEENTRQYKYRSLIQPGPFVQ
jgi:aminobenzoyl-glutamate utilization protein B